MKLYLSSIRIPTPQDLSKLIGKPLAEVSVALIPNAQDYYSERARAFKIAEVVIKDGLHLVPFVVLPHVDNPEFAEVIPIVKDMHAGKHEVVELKDTQAVIFDGDRHWTVESSV